MVSECSSIRSQSRNNPKELEMALRLDLRFKQNVKVDL